MTSGFDVALGVTPESPSGGNKAQSHPALTPDSFLLADICLVTKVVRWNSRVSSRPTTTMGFLIQYKSPLPTGLRWKFSRWEGLGR